MRKPSAARFAEREVHGVDDRGEPERIVIWIERLPGATWAVGRAVNPQHRRSDEARADDYVFQGFELTDALMTRRWRWSLSERPQSFITSVGSVGELKNASPRLFIDLDSA